LALLGKEKIFKNTYLAGGTALALQLGHRISYDLDFFTNKIFDRKMIIQRLQTFGFKLGKEAEGTILGELGNIKFSLFYYKYPLIFPTKKYLGINLADIKDIAAMKIDASSSRGTKRDFVDLYYLVKQITLDQMLIFYNKKFKLLKTNRVHILKSLDYFTDADKDADPKMLVEKYSWPKIKKFLRNEVMKITKN
jgi:hypothetical protein